MLLHQIPKTVDPFRILPISDFGVRGVEETKVGGILHGSYAKDGIRKKLLRGTEPIVIYFCQKAYVNDVSAFPARQGKASLGIGTGHVSSIADGNSYQRRSAQGV